MAVLDFPNTGLTTGTTYTGDNGTVYIYDGVKWVGQATSNAGPAGPTGPSGPQGAASTVAGPTGPAGAQGQQGVQGPSGVQGPTGPVSTIPGPTGPAGVQGPSGPSGPDSVRFGQAGFLTYYETTGTVVRPNPFLNLDLNNGLVKIGDVYTATLYISRNDYSPAQFVGFVFAQHHDTPDAVNFNFYRSRGTSSSPSAILAGDDIADIVFTGRGSGVDIPAASIGVSAEADPVGINLAARISFVTNTGAGPQTQAELSSTGTWRIRRLAPFIAPNLNLDGNFVPIRTNEFNLGGPVRYWNHAYVNTVTSNLLYVNSGTMYLNNFPVSVDGSGIMSINGLSFPDGTTQTTAFSFIDSIPASSTSTGIKGQIAVDSTSMYVCVATDNWLKFVGTTF